MLHQKKIRGLDTGWIEQGKRRPSAPLFFLIHGFPDSPAIWAPLLSQFSQDTSVVAPFLRGVGPSEVGPKSRFGPSAMAQDFLEILFEIDPNRKCPIYIVCHDIGVDAGWEFARLLKGDLKALVMLNGFSSDHFLFRLGDPIQVVKSWYMGFFQIPVLPEKILQSSKVSKFSGALKAANYPLGESEWKKSLPLVECYRQSARFALSSLFKKPPAIESPLYVLWGRKDPYLNIPNAADFVGRSPKTQMKVFDAGHWLQYEIPEVIHAELVKIQTQTQ